MKALALFSVLLLVSGAASAAGKGDYMTLSWNQSTKEVISALAVGDYDGDGSREVAVAASSEGSVYCFSSGGKLEWKFDAPSYIFTVKTLDVTGDGRMEVAAGGGQHLYVVNGSGETVWKHYTGNNPVRRIEGFDADGDGRSDLIYGTFKDECETSYVSAVDENGSSMWTYDLGFYYPNVIKAFSDANGTDYISVGTVYRAKDTARKSCGPGYTTTASVIMLNVRRERLWEYLTVGGVTVIEAGDLNGDSVPEILAGTYPTLYALDLSGRQLWNYTTVDRVDSLAVGDLNGDGAAEVVVGANHAYILDGSGRELAVAKTDSRVYTLRIADLNGDGKSEIIAGSNGVYVFNYKGEKLYQSDKVVSVGDLEVADLDGDGYSEVVAGAVKSVRVYATGFQSKQQKAEAFYNMARDYYMKGDFERALAYTEKAREAFFEIGDLKSMSAAISFRDRIKQTMSGGLPAGEDTIPSLEGEKPTFLDSIYAKLSSLKGVKAPKIDVAEILETKGTTILILSVVLLVVAVLLLLTVLSLGKRRGMQVEELRQTEDETPTREQVFQTPIEKTERHAPYRIGDNPRFLKSRERRAGAKI